MALTMSMTSMRPAACTEPDLIDAAREGDDRAFEELYSRYQQRIRAFIHSRVQDYGRSEDVAQEVFISALRRLRASRQPIVFKPWIYEIAKNACIDEYRRSQRSNEVSLELDGDGSGSSRPLLSLAPTPPAAVESKQRLTNLKGAFGGLSENHHQLLVLREFEGLSYEQIGDRTGMSKQMVESALFRARRKLQEEYDELSSGRRCQQIQSAIEDGRALSRRSFGVRERRQFARHLAHCQPCRVKAHLAGVDDSLVRPAGLGAKIAALLPFPLWRWPWSGRAARNAMARTGSHPTTLQSLQSASTLADPATASTLSGAAVAAAVLALAGSGGIATPASGHHAHPLLRPAPALAPASHGAGIEPIIRSSAASVAGRREGSLAVGAVAPRVVALSHNGARHARTVAGGPPGSEPAAASGGRAPSRTLGTAGVPTVPGAPATPGPPTLSSVTKAAGTIANAVGKTANQLANVMSAATPPVAENAVDSTVQQVSGSAAAAGSSAVGAIKKTL